MSISSPSLGLVCAWAGRAVANESAVLWLSLSTVGDVTSILFSHCSVVRLINGKVTFRLSADKVVERLFRGLHREVYMSLKLL
jgi:hypothetical protein